MCVCVSSTLVGERLLVFAFFFHFFLLVLLVLLSV